MMMESPQDAWGTHKDDQEQQRREESNHIGDPDFYEENLDDIGDASWTEVFET